MIYWQSASDSDQHSLDKSAWFPGRALLRTELAMKKSYVLSYKCWRDGVYYGPYKTVVCKGYRVAYWYIKRQGQRREYEHRLVWARHFGPIPPGYQVHHIDECKTNNSIDNLRCIEMSKHASEHRWLAKRSESISYKTRGEMCSKGCGRIASRKGLCHSCYQVTWQQAKRQNMRI